VTKGGIMRQKFGIDLVKVAVSLYKTFGAMNLWDRAIVFLFVPGCIYLFIIEPYANWNKRHKAAEFDKYMKKLRKRKK
jgi:hypothetical protein